MSAAELWERACAAGTPLVGPVGDDGMTEVTFVWRGEAERTRVGWGHQLDLRREPGTDIWWATTRLPATMRTIYFLTHTDPHDWATPKNDSGTGRSHIDTLNPHRAVLPGDPGDPTDSDTHVSLLTLPAAPPEPWCLPHPGTPAGQVSEHDLGAGHRVALYLPPGAPTAALPLVIVFDGYLGRTFMGMPTTFDNLIAAGRIPPVAAVFVHGNDDTRDADLVPTSTGTAAFVTGTLLPWARSTTGISPDPYDIALAGMSLGGLAAVHLAFAHPELFGAAISHSGSFWWPEPREGPPEWLTAEILRLPRRDVRFYLDVGLFENTEVLPGVPDQLSANRRLRDALRRRGYDVTYAEYPGYHDYINWRNTFADALIALFGPPRTNLP